jgi:hypothetical protein
MPIENPELNRLGDVRRLDCIGPAQVGDRARHSQNPYVSTCRQSKPVVGRFEQSLSLTVELTPTRRLTSVDSGVQPPRSHTVGLPAAGSSHPDSNGGCRLARDFPDKVSKRDRTDADVEVDPVEQRTRQSSSIPLTGGR